MYKFVLKRIFYGILTIWTIVTVTFFLLHAMPGDPFSSEKNCGAKVKENLMKMYNLDKPLHQQYFLHIKNLLRGDFGISLATNRSVNRQIYRAIPCTLDIALHSFFFVIVFGILFGTIAALNRGKKKDIFCMVLVALGMSVPNFVIAGLSQLIFGAWLKWLPVAGYKGFWSFKYKVLPIILNTILPLAMATKIIRAATMEVLSQDYIKSAKAKGLSSFLVLRKHVLRNSIIPLLSYGGLIFVSLVTGSFVIEHLFLIPGLGQQMFNGIMGKDYTLVLGLVTLSSILFIAVMILLDIIYCMVDKRME